MKYNLDNGRTVTLNPFEIRAGHSVEQQIVIEIEELSEPLDRMVLDRSAITAPHATQFIDLQSPPQQPAKHRVRIL